MLQYDEIWYAVCKGGPTATNGYKKGLVRVIEQLFSRTSRNVLARVLSLTNGNTDLMGVNTIRPNRSTRIPVPFQYRQTSC